MSRRRIGTRGSLVFRGERESVPKIRNKKVKVLTLQAIYVMYIANIGGSLMPNTANRSRDFLDIEPELRNRLKAFAALRGKTLKEWLTEAIIAKLEDEMYEAEGLAAFSDNDDQI